MNYCHIEDLQRDELLRSVVSQDDVGEADAYIRDLSWSVGIDPINIPNTDIPYKVKQLAINYALMTAAGNKSRMNQKGVDGVDAYELKRKTYKEKVDALTNDIKDTPSVLLGPHKKRSSFMTIRMLRS